MGMDSSNTHLPHTVCTDTLQGSEICHSSNAFTVSTSKRYQVDCAIDASLLWTGCFFTVNWQVEGFTFWSLGKNGYKNAGIRVSRQQGLPHPCWWQHAAPCLPPSHRQEPQLQRKGATLQWSIQSLKFWRLPVLRTHRLQITHSHM